MKRKVKVAGRPTQANAAKSCPHELWMLLASQEELITNGRRMTPARIGRFNQVHQKVLAGSWKYLAIRQVV